MGSKRNIFSIDLRITGGSQYLTTPFMMEYKNGCSAFDGKS